MVESISSTTALIHAGKCFDVSTHGTILTTASAYLLCKTGDIVVHFHNINVVASQGNMLISFYEAPTVTANGTLKDTPNRNCISTNISQSKVYEAPTVTVDGTLKGSNLIVPSTTLAGAQQGGEEGEWVLKPNTDYIIKLTNQAASTTTYNASFFYYETEL